MRYLIICVLLIGCNQPSIADLKLKREEMQNISERAWVEEYAAGMDKDTESETEYRAKKEAALLRVKELDRAIEVAAAR